MVRQLELPAFVMLATVLHLGLFLTLPEGAAGDAGAGGDVAISLTAISGDLDALVEAFETPPEALTRAPQMDPTPLAPDQPPEAISPATPAAPPPEPPRTLSAPSETPPLRLDTAPPTPADLPRPDALADLPPPALPSLDMPQAIPTPRVAEPDPAPAPAPPAAQMPPPDPATPPPPPAPPAPPEPAVAQAQLPEAAKSPPAPRPERAQAPKAETAAAPQPAAPPQKAQRAKGDGDAAAAGRGTQTDISSLSPGVRERLMTRWGSQIRARVERRKPSGTRDRGTAVVRLVVSTEGQLVAVSLAQSSGVAAIDAAAISAVQHAGRFPKAPRDLDGTQHAFTLPIRFGR